MNTVCIDRKTARELPIVSAMRKVVERTEKTFAVSRDRPRLALIAAPLVMTAAALQEQWWLWVPLTSCAWGMNRRRRWSWLMSLQLGVVGFEWAYVGAVALGTWPDHRLAIGVTWAGVAVALAIAGALSDRYQNLPERGLRW